MKKPFIMAALALALAVSVPLRSQNPDLLETIEASGEFAPMFPFLPTHNNPDNLTNVRTWAGVSDSPAGANGFISVQGDHFVDGNGKEIRFIGTNIGMKGCFPEHNLVDSLAAELSRYGINICRIHYSSLKRPQNGYPVQDSFIEPVQLEKFDYLFSKLKEHGIYVYFQLNIARHFGRNNGFENANKLPYYNNGIDNIDYRMIQMQKRFHKEILNHVNPYTGLAYKDDPAIATMELANENSIIYAWFSKKHNFPFIVEPYRSQIREMWNNYLIGKYADTQTLRKAWFENNGGDGSEVYSGGIMNEPGKAGLDVQLSGGTQASLQYVKAKSGDKLKGQYFARLEVKTVSKDKANPKLYVRGLELKAWKPYCLRFKIRTEKSTPVIVRIGQAKAPYKGAGFATTVRTTNNWKEFVYNFSSEISDSDLRITFQGFDPGIVDIADISLVCDYESIISNNQSLEEKNIDWPYPVAYFTPYQRALDFTEFLSTFESSYFKELYDYVKKDLGVKVPVTGTQLSYGFNQPMSRMDYCDMHSYWCHPYFPGGKWDWNAWQLRNSCIASTNTVYKYSSPGSTFTKMAHSRILGKPFTVSEYDHPNLNFYCAEANLMLAATGAFQNWSGLMQFAWILSDDFHRDHIVEMFDMCSVPQKLVHFPACYAMFVRGDVKKGNASAVYAYPSEFKIDLEEITRAKDSKGHEDPHSKLLEALPLALPSGRQVVENPSIYSTEGKLVISKYSEVPESIRQAYENKLMKSSTGQITWNWQQEDAGLFMVDTRNTKVFSGFVRGREFVYSGMKLVPGKTRLDWLTLSLTMTSPIGASKPGNILRPGTYLLAATGLVHNTGAKIVSVPPKEHGRISCSEADGGAQGSAPVLCEGIDAQLIFAGIGNRMKCYALDPDGQRVCEVPVTVSPAGEAQLHIGPQYRTVWYELTIEEKQ